MSATGRRNLAMRRALAPLALMALIFALSALSDAGGEREAWELVARKLAHFGEYLVLTILWAWALRPLTPSAVALAALISILYAASDELHQTFVPGRTGTPRDVLIDAAGIIVAVLLLRYHRQLRGVVLGEARGE